MGKIKYEGNCVEIIIFRRKMKVIFWEFFRGTLWEILSVFFGLWNIRSSSGFLTTKLAIFARDIHMILMFE